MHHMIQSLLEDLAFHRARHYLGQKEKDCVCFANSALQECFGKKLTPHKKNQVYYSVWLKIKSWGSTYLLFLRVWQEFCLHSKKLLWRTMIWSTCKRLFFLYIKQWIWGQWTHIRRDTNDKLKQKKSVFCGRGIIPLLVTAVRIGRNPSAQAKHVTKAGRALFMPKTFILKAPLPQHHWPKSLKIEEMQCRQALHSKH